MDFLLECFGPQNDVKLSFSLNKTVRKLSGSPREDEPLGQQHCSKRVTGDSKVCSNSGNRKKLFNLEV